MRLSEQVLYFSARSRLVDKPRQKGADAVCRQRQPDAVAAAWRDGYGAAIGVFHLVAEIRAWSLFSFLPKPLTMRLSGRFAGEPDQAGLVEGDGARRSCDAPCRAALFERGEDPIVFAVALEFLERSLQTLDQLGRQVF